MDAKKLKLIAAGIIVVLFAIVIFQNFENITIKILMAKIEMPVALLLILTFGIGLIAGWTITLARARFSKTSSAKQ